MPPHYPSLLRLLRFSFSKLTIFISFLLALVLPACAIPIQASSHQVPDLWAQLLRADRFKLIRSPTWVTRGFQPDRPLNASFPQTPLTDKQVSQDSSSTATSSQLNLTPSIRQKTYQSEKASSKFTCHVFNPPPNLNIDVVISRVLLIASRAWVSDQDVLMKVDFRDIGEPTVLANGGGTYFVQMSDTFTTVLPVAAAEAIRKSDLNGNEADDGKYDVLATVNSRTDWYDGVNGNPPPTKYDLITVLLHEIYHNLVFAGSVTATYEKIPNSNDAIQDASIHKGYLTRFDSFLMNEGNCAVLGYLTDKQLSEQLNRPPSQLLADAVCNDKLYWGYGNERIAKLFSPRVFQKRSSIYHFDPQVERKENSLMYPTVRIGSAQHVVGPKMLEMQRVTLDPSITGANQGCPRPLQNPTPRTPIQPDDYNEPPGQYDGGPLVIDNQYREEEGNRIAGLPRWAFALIIVFAILLALLLLGLCLALLVRILRKKGKAGTFRSSSSSYPTTKQGPGTRTSSSSRSKTYIPGVGGSVSKSKKSRTSASSRTSRLTTSVQPTSKHTSTSRKTSSKHTTEPRPVTERTSSKRFTTCPSTGKSRYLCCCKCCKSSITPPPPVASVHTFDPDCVPTSHKHKSTHKTRTHKHIHSCQKTVKKTCKSKSSRSCSCACYCCRYKPSSCKTSTTCCKSSCKASSSRCPPSTKPPSTKPPSTKVASSSRHCCSSRHCTSKSSSSKSCSCSKSASKLPSTKPPSTKPPAKTTSSKSCKTCKPSCKTCKPSGNGCACNRCEQIVEINIC